MTLELMSPAPVRDRAGFAVFSDGSAGSAHALAHRMLDEGRHELGHRLLGQWLAQHGGAGSDWTHLQWHMAVFEIAVGRWNDALARFEREIAPVAVGTFDALTDGPAMLWRLWLAAPRAVALPWNPIADTARQSLEARRNPYVELHGVLALAGAGDARGIDAWLDRRTVEDERAALLVKTARGLRALAAAHHAEAGTILTATAPHVGQIGGSHAQNQLFHHLAAFCQHQSSQAAA